MSLPERDVSSGRSFRAHLCVDDSVARRRRVTWTQRRKLLSEGHARAGGGRGRVLALSGCGFEDRPAFGYAAT